METTYSFELEDHLSAIERLINQQTWQLVKAGRIQSADREDFGQDLMLQVVKAWPQLAQTDFEPIGFARLVVRQKTINLLRRPRCQEQQVAGTEELAVMTNSASALDAHDTMAAFSDEDQALVQSLMDVGYSKTARSLGIDRNALMRRVRVIRKQIREHAAV
jgi:DNA-directed RNA polymerase specialized sigma24 family protein